MNKSLPWPSLWSCGLPCWKLNERACGGQAKEGEKRPFPQCTPNEGGGQARACEARGEEGELEQEHGQSGGDEQREEKQEEEEEEEGRFGGRQRERGRRSERARAREKNDAEKGREEEGDDQE